MDGRVRWFLGLARNDGGYSLPMTGTPCDVPLPRKMNENAMRKFSFRGAYHNRRIRRMKTQLEGKLNAETREIKSNVHCESSEVIHGLPGRSAGLRLACHRNPEVAFREALLRLRCAA